MLWCKNRDGFHDLKEKTDLIFEEFRRDQLTSRGVKDVIMQSDDNFQETLAADRIAWEEKSKREEEELAAKFRSLMEAKEEDLKKKELEVCNYLFTLPKVGLKISKNFLT